MIADLMPFGSTPGGGQPGAAPPHISSIFLPNDLLYVWFLSLSISLVAGLSCLESITSITA